MSCRCRIIPFVQFDFGCHSEHIYSNRSIQIPTTSTWLYSKQSFSVCWDGNWFNCCEKRRRNQPNRPTSLCHRIKLIQFQNYSKNVDHRRATIPHSSNRPNRLSLPSVDNRQIEDTKRLHRNQMNHRESKNKSHCYQQWTIRIIFSNLYTIVYSVFVLLYVFGMYGIW